MYQCQIIISNLSGKMFYKNYFVNLNASLDWVNFLNIRTYSLVGHRKDKLFSLWQLKTG